MQAVGVPQSVLPYGKLNLHNVPSDGNCFYHAVSHILNRSHQKTQQMLSHVQVRKAVVDASIDYQDIIPVELFLEPGTTLEKWRKHMSRLGTWGDELSVLLVCLKYRIRIMVHRITMSPPPPSNDSRGVRGAKRAVSVPQVVCEQYPLSIAQLEEIGMGPNGVFRQMYEDCTSEILKRRKCFHLQLEKEHYSAFDVIPSRTSTRLQEKRTLGKKQCDTYDSEMKKKAMKMTYADCVMGR